LAGLRRKGYTSSSILSFCEDIGVTRVENLIQIEKLEHFCRVDLDANANRVFVVLDPIKIIIENYPDDKFEEILAPNHPKDESKGKRTLYFSKIVYIDRNDFKEKDETDFYGLSLNKEVNLKYSYNITCTGILKKEGDKILELSAIVDINKKNKCKGKSF
jgi:glutaminyl-tRNA synthetase